MVVKAGPRRPIDGYCLALFVGYGLFRCLMNGTYSSAMSTVVNIAPVSAVNLEFAVASSFSILVTAAALVVVGCLRPVTRLRLPGALSAIVLLVMNLLSCLGVFGAALNGEAGMFVLAAVWGVTSIVANAAWLVPFAGLGPRRCLTTLIAGMLVSSLATLGLNMLPAGAQVPALSCAGAASVVLFCLIQRMDDPVKALAALLGGTRGDEGAQAAGPVRAEGLPSREGACSAGGSCAARPAAGSAREAARRTGGLLAELWGPLVIYASLTMLAGFATAFMGMDVDVSPGVSTVVEGVDGVGAAARAVSPATSSLPLGNLASLAAVVFLAVLAFVSNRMFDLTRTFRRAFPIIALLLVALPFTDDSFGLFFRAALSFLNTIVNVSMLFLLLETARVRQAPPVAVVGAAMFIARVALLASLAAGMGIDAQRDLDGTVRAMVLVVAGIYLLSMTLVLLTRKQGRAASGVSVSLASSEVAFNHPQSATAALSPQAEEEEVVPSQCEPAGSRVTAPRPTSHDARSLLERRADDIAAACHLTPREREVVLLLAQGRSAPFIGNELGLATNTVRGYVQEAYSKLGVHSKQELIDLLTGEGPEGSKDSKGAEGPKGGVR